MAARTKRTTNTSAESDVRMAPENIQDGAMESIKQEKVVAENKENTITIPVSKYEQMLEALTAFISEQAKAGSSSENKKIQRDEYIEVISLTPMLVTVTANAAGGSGREYNFKGFGVSIEIPYADLANIVQKHFKFFEKGYLYVNDARFTKTNGLDQITSKILTKEQIEVIIYGDNQSSLALFEKGTTSQKNIIASMLIKELVENKDIDMNKIKKISDFVGFDLNQRAEEFKEILEEIKNK